jgi:hypothetical protein
METRLYSPVKRFLEGFGFEVKGEVCGCDLVALDRGTPVALVFGELKLSFTLELVLQAVDRSAACDEVWLAVCASARGRGRESDPRVKKLCRLLGFGLLAVSDSGKVEVLVEPVPFRGDALCALGSDEGDGSADVLDDAPAAIVGELEPLGQRRQRLGGRGLGHEANIARGQ